MISLPGVEDSVWYLTVLLKTSAGEQEVGEAVGLTMLTRIISQKLLGNATTSAEVHRTRFPTHSKR